METDAEVFNCDTCEVARRFRELDAENAEAWAVYHRICSRFARETQTVGLQLERLLAGMDDEAALVFCDRLAVLHDVLVPVRTAPDGA